MEIERVGVREKSSEAVIYNGVAYLTGKVSSDMNLDFEGQCKSALKNLDDVLNKIGTHRGNILTATVYFKDIENIDKFNEIWNKWLTIGSAPARNCVQANMTDSKYLVEITVEVAV